MKLAPVSYIDLEGWREDDHEPALAALLRCMHHVTEVKPYRTGSLGLTTQDFLPVWSALKDWRPGSREETRQFFESHFRPFRVGDPDCGLVTAYYEPELVVSNHRSERFCHPLYRRPDDLIDIDDGNRPPGMAPDYAFGRTSADGVGEYPDRQSIDRRFLDGRGLEIAWAENKVDVFFVHVQGSARLLFSDGSMRRITYAAKAGHPYTSIGKVLVAQGIFTAGEATMTGIRQWFARHPDRVDDILWRNRSYIFFREAGVDDARLGPVAAAKVPLEPGRSLAVDRMIHTFATPFFIRADSLHHLTGSPFRRLMIAQDTGSAIVGPARGDIFAGTGHEAGELAGSVNHAADFIILIPAAAAERYL